MTKSLRKSSGFRSNSYKPGLEQVKQICFLINFEQSLHSSCGHLLYAHMLVQNVTYPFTRDAHSISNPTHLQSCITHNQIMVFIKYLWRSGLISDTVLAVFKLRLITEHSPKIGKIKLYINITSLYQWCHLSKFSLNFLNRLVCHFLHLQIDCHKTMDC